MKPSEEQRLGKKIIAAQERLRQCLCKTGAAVQWHLTKAKSVARKPKLLERVAPHLDGDPAKEYLAALPGWIEQTTRQDATCADTWTKRRAAYPAQRDHLVAMLVRYDFSLRSYEKLARQSRMELVETPASKRSANPEAPHDETATRMTEEEFCNLQQQIDSDLQMLDQARSELMAGHEDLLVKLVQKDIEKTSDPVDEVTTYARSALVKAAENFDVRQGRRFGAYAQWWIKTAIKEKKTWEK